MLALRPRANNRNAIRQSTGRRIEPRGVAAVYRHRMRMRHLVHEIRSALHVSKICCELSDVTIEAMVRESIEELGRRRESRIVACALAKAQHACEEIRAWRDGAEPRRKQGRSKPVKRRRPRRRG